MNRTVAKQREFDIDFDAELPGNTWFFEIELLKRVWHCARQHVVNLIESGDLFAVDLKGKGSTKSMWRVPRAAAIDLMNRRKGLLPNRREGDEFEIDFDSELPAYARFFPVFLLAKIFRCHRQHVINLIESGDLKVPIDLRGPRATKSMWRAPRPAVVEFLNNRKVQL